MDQLSGRKPLWTYMIMPAAVVTLLAVVFFIEEGFNLNLGRFGLRPRDYNHPLGIFTFFFLHGSFEHLFNNSVGLFVLLSLLRYFFPTLFFKVLVISILVPAVLTFFLGQSGSVHIGASGAVYTLAAFLFVSSIIRYNRYLLALSMLIAFLYGGLWWGVFPIEEHISYEGHLSGAITGFVFSIIFIKAPINDLAKEPEPKFEDDNQPDIIGDSWKVTQDIHITYTYRDHKPVNGNNASSSSEGESSANPGVDSTGRED